MRWLIACTGVAVLAGTALGQGEIDGTNSMSWSENTGFMEWSFDKAETVSIETTYLEGKIWCENIGWLDLGVGPANGVAYANTLASDCGVNVDVPTGELSGFAWGENVGWVNFSGGALATPANPARIDSAAGRFRGFAWGENLGWINLDDSVVFVGLSCPCDWDGSGGVDITDLLGFMAAWFELESASDFDGSGIVDIGDLLGFLGCWFAATEGSCF